MSKKKPIKKERQVKELFDLEIDEVSAVDKPAIGEEFYITKSVKNKKGATVKEKPIKKSVAWKQVVSKGVSDENTHCVFCGITHEEEAEQLGMGLIKGVCFECACENEGVFDAIMNDSFDAEQFQKDNPEIELKLSLQKEDDSDEDEDTDEEGDEEEESEDDSDEEESEEDEEESEDDSDEEDESKKSKTPASVKDQTSQESNDELDLEKKVEKLEKNLEEVSAMLERSLELHDIAAMALNEIVGLTFGSLDGLMMMMEEQMSEDSKAKELFNEIIESIKSDKLIVSKKGAKISGKRMAVLREISEKLGELIASVMGEAEKGNKMKKSADEIQKSLEEMKEELKQSIEDSSSSIKEDIDKKLERLDSKLKHIEESGGGTFDLGDEDEEDDEEEQETEKSIFSSVVGLDDITKSIERKRRNLK